ncbi:hypothetical protein DYB28_013763 [Aphanomyces astaci]|uniref:Uncharacterized protein n=1 Tax=Aphanomyces astaci TaxID=112090 RepID=A0A9X8DS90_APHAT|nr:hypothetical protein DYB28_013763 [Aphanomyces astaci]
MLHAHLQLHDATSHVTKTLRLLTNALQRISLILLQLLQGKFHLHDPTTADFVAPATTSARTRHSSKCCGFGCRFSVASAAKSDAGPLPPTPMSEGYLHQALDSCQSFKHGIVLQSRHAMPLHLPLNRRQASDHGVMLRRARLKSNQTPRHVVGDVSVCICRTTSSW